MWYYQNPQTLNEGRKYYQEGLSKGMSDKDARAYAYKYIFLSTECMDVPDNAYHDGIVTNRSVQILSKLAKGEKPFFLATGFNLPHLPFCCPKKYWDLYDRAAVPLAQFQEHAKNSPELAYHNSSELRTYTDIPPLVSFTDVKINRIGLPITKQTELIHGYYACTSYIDAQVGKLLHTLDSLKLTDHTIIVLWGDHGWHLGDHDLWNKHTNFENAARAPLMISAPEMRGGKATAVSEFVDIFPTLCALSGLPVPENLDGKSLVPMMQEHRSQVKDFAVSQYPHQGKMGYSIRTKSYRLTWWMKNGYRSYNPFSKDLIVAKELYDYEKDPLETVNVVDEKAYQAIAREMEEKMISFLKSQQKSEF
jgi:arylsulfatase A-like enzyme